MEFPDLGKNCSHSSCQQLDFLPMKCDACSLIYCKDHILYAQHSCTESYKKENQVPVCPLCSKPIPLSKGEVADVKVGQHIDNDCQSDPAKEKRNQVYTNKCSNKGCKTKELLPFTCDKCRLNYCIRHRHETDHNCKGFQNTGGRISNPGAAALNRFGKQQQNKAPNRPPQTTALSSIGGQLNRERLARQQGGGGPARSAASVQGGMSEDEALAQAMALSMAESSTSQQPAKESKNSSQQQQEDEDLALARALAASEQEQRAPRRQTSKEKSCTLS